MGKDFSVVGDGVVTTECGNKGMIALRIIILSF